jgi:limonene-1,2-epoxide hydrolase
MKTEYVNPTNLQQIFDSVDHSSDKWQSYFDVYERHLNKFRDKPFNMVEVGVQKGGSLEMWGKYFLEAKITGIDVDRECSKLVYDNPNISVAIGDQGSEAFWDGFLAASSQIDVFIDDGGHFMDQQILTFEKVFPKMPIGGVYICEDCHTSYMGYNQGGYKRKSSFIEYAKGFIDAIHYDWKEEYDTEWERKAKLANGLTSIHFYDSMIVFEKFGKKDMHRVKPDQFI